MSFGFSGSQAYANNDYTGTVNTMTNMHNGYVRGFTEWKQRSGQVQLFLRGIPFLYMDAAGGGQTLQHGGIPK